MKREIITAAAAALLATTASAQVLYSYDDGTGGNAGPGAVGTPGQFLWGNVFQAEQGGEEIYEIHVAVGRLPVGAEIRVMLFEDPNDDGNPDDGVLIATQGFTPDATQSNTFTVVPITPRTVAGTFFAACTTAVDGTSATWAARTDFQTGQASGHNTYFYWGPAFDPSTLQGYSNRARYAGVATAMVRAAGREPTPPCEADIGVTGGGHGSDGRVDNNDFISFIDYFFIHDPLADIGSTGGVESSDGAFDNNDFVVFIDRFFECA
ncbi:MAG TPA: GC-type dockerin domain-anchored protein [Phycisphaerales bacterium]|nr:GC-type dockerin domain-anchored protein [Phycisphaerales bacterium]